MNIIFNLVGLLLLRMVLELTLELTINVLLNSLNGRKCFFFKCFAIINKSFLSKPTE